METRDISKSIVLTFGAFFISFAAQASPSFFSVDPNEKIVVDAKLVSQLKALKAAEESGEVAACVKAAKGIAKKVSVYPWVQRALLNCLYQAELTQSGAGGSRLLQTIRQLSEQDDVLADGVAGESLQSLLDQSRLLWLRNSALKNSTDAHHLIGEIISTSGNGNAAAKAEALAWSARLATQAGKLVAAASFYEQSLAEKENEEARAEYLQILLQLNFPQEKKDSTDAGAPSAEGEFENRLKASLQSGDSINLLEDLVAYLNAHPTGKRSKWASEKGMEILQSILGKALIGKDNALAGNLRDRAFGITKNLEFTRQSEWARVLHRRGEWWGSQKLAEQALVSMGNTSGAAVLLYVAGRSAQFAGDYALSRVYFEKYAQAHGGAEDLAEVLFRLGLSYVRAKEHASAIAIFERMLAPGGSSRYDLWAWYWMVRSLQVTKSDRAPVELQKLILKYPFSYYGMRLRSETADYVWQWPPIVTNEKPEAKTWILSSAHKQTWDRFQVLKEVGWSEEALFEIEALPKVQDPHLKVLLAKSFAGAKVYPPVIRFLNQAGDQAEELRSAEWIALGFPQFHKEAVEKEAKKYNLSPWIVLSLMRQESAFNPRAVSTSNALGLMQMIPPTAREIAQDLKLKKVEIPRSLFRPELNIQMGTYYLGKLVKEFNQSVPMALAAYNAGPHRLKTFFRARNPKIEGLNLSLDPFAEIWMDELPWFETSYYVKSILRNYLIYQALDEGRVDLRKVIQEGLVLSPNSSAQVQSQSKVR